MHQYPLKQQVAIYVQKDTIARVVSWLNVQKGLLIIRLEDIQYVLPALNQQIPQQAPTLHQQNKHYVRHVLMVIMLQLINKVLIVIHVLGGITVLVGR